MVRSERRKSRREAGRSLAAKPGENAMNKRIQPLPVASRVGELIACKVSEGKMLDSGGLATARILCSVRTLTTA